MRKVVGLAVAVVLGIGMSAAAEEVKGTVKAIDRADQSFVLEDGTRLSVSESRLGDLAPGDRVQAVYQIQGGKKVVTDLDHRPTIGGQETTNFGSLHGAEIDSLQSE